MTIDVCSLLAEKEWVRGIARSLLFDPDRADDVVQETWLAALMAPPRHSSSLRGWLRSVVRNRSQNVIRTERRRRERERAVARPEVRSRPDMDDQLDLHQRLAEAIVELDPTHRTVIHLRYFQDQTFEAIGRETGVPSATVRSQHRRALDRLRRAIASDPAARRSSAHALLALAGLDPGVVSSITTTSVTTGGAGVAASLAVGGAVMSGKTAIVSSAMVILPITTGVLYYQLEVTKEELKIAREASAPERPSSGSQVLDTDEEARRSVPTPVSGQPVNEPVVASRGDDRSRPPLESVDDLCRMLEKLIDDGSQERFEFQRLLVALVQNGSPRAMDAVFETMENPKADFSHRAMFFLTLLRDVDDPRVSVVASRVLDRNLSDGLDSWYRTKGYIGLIAAQGGVRATEKLLELIRTGSAQVRHEAARVLSEVEPALHTEFLQLIHDPKTPGHLVSFVAASLASWNDPAITDALLELSADTSRADQQRRTLNRALGENLERNFEGFVSPYWSAQSASEKTIAFQRIRGLAGNPRLGSDLKSQLVMPILKDALGQESDQLLNDALNTIGAHGFLQVGEIEDILVDTLDRASPRSQVEIRRTLAKIKKSKSP